MPSKETVQRQRAFGGALGVLVLAFGLTYHFFPEIFHVSPEEVANPTAPGVGRAAPSTAARANPAIPSAQDEINAGPPLTRRMIFESVWENYFDPGTNLINVHIARLRRKIDTPGLTPLIRTERGQGYMLHAP